MRQKWYCFSTMKNRATYRIRNHREYDISLQKRGSLTFWLSQEALQQWVVTERTGGRGAVTPRRNRVPARP